MLPGPTTVATDSGETLHAADSVAYEKESSLNCTCAVNATVSPTAAERVKGNTPKKTGVTSGFVISAVVPQ